MKLFGNSRHARHASKKVKGHGCLTVLLILAIIAGGAAYFLTSVRPPDITDKPVDQPGDNDDITGFKRRDGTYTFLMLGLDQVSGNTDTIMMGTYDKNAKTLEVVSIPRDTMANVATANKRVNTLYGGNINNAKKGFANIVGYQPDFYVVVNLDAFIKLVDSVGGIWYDVPDVEGGGRGMNYDDPEQGLSIHLTPGYQLLSGEQAIGIVRYRKGYSTADIGRINSQQKFLTAAMSQIIENRENLKITDIISIFLKYVKTDLSVGECTWFAEELLGMNMENVSFHTMPGNYDETVKGRAYVSVKLAEWLEMINTYINPFNKPITEDNLDVLTRDPKTGKLYSTTGEYADDPSWGN